MSPSRREFWKVAGATAAVPWLCGAADAEAQALGTISDETLNQLLDLHGGRGIYAHPERFAELRSAVVRMMRSHQQLRRFALPDDAQPAFVFRRG